MARLKREMGCGCVLGLDYDDTLAIFYCHKHGATEDMYEALEAMKDGSFLDPENPNRVWERATPNEGAIIKAFQALAKAEGE